MTEIATTAPAQERAPRASWIGHGAIIGLGALLDLASRYAPAELPFWMPWQFVWWEYLAVALSLYWLALGLHRMRREERPPVWRSLSFVVGVLGCYAVVQTHYDFLSQHMFFLHRFQHLVLHHLGPFLIALGTAGPVVWRGMPDVLKPVVRSAPARAAVDFIQHPAVAPVAFVGLIYFWLLPSVHVRVMLDERLYNLMNASMAVDGIFFWCLVLDPRPKPPARFPMGLRALLVGLIVPPQLVVGAVLALSNSDIYPVYRICGRLFAISAITDQHYGGLILWIPSSMMSVIALILVLNNLRLVEER